MANPMDPVLSHHTSQERQPAAVPELPNNKPQSPKQSHAEDHAAQTEATSGEDHRRRTGRLQSERSTTEQIFNLRIICEKYLQHQQDLYHVFIDFKKAFDRVWHAALWTTMKYNIKRYGQQCSLLQLQYRRLVPNDSWSPTGMSTLTHSLQHSCGKDHDRHLRRP